MLNFGGVCVMATSKQTTKQPTKQTNQPTNKQTNKQTVNLLEKNAWEKVPKIYLFLKWWREKHDLPLVESLQNHLKNKLEVCLLGSFSTSYIGDKLVPLLIGNQQVYKPLRKLGWCSHPLHGWFEVLIFFHHFSLGSFLCGTHGLGILQQWDEDPGIGDQKWWGKWCGKSIYQAQRSTIDTVSG